MPHNESTYLGLSRLLLGGGLGGSLEASLLLLLGLRAVLVQEFEQLRRSVLVESVGELGDGRGHLQALVEDDFLALLQKQFPTNAFDLSPPDGIDPISISSLPIPNPTPPSTDSSPSPPSVAQEPPVSRRQSGVYSQSPVGADSNDDPTLKRKASDDDDDGDEPTHKTAHTGTS